MVRMRDWTNHSRNDSFFSSLIKDSFKMNESFKTDPSLATSARAAKESGSYLCASNVTPTAVRFIVSVFLCLLCSCRMPSTQMTCSHFRKNRPKKRQKPAGCRSRIISKNRPVPIFGRSTGASLCIMNAILFWHPVRLKWQGVTLTWAAVSCPFKLKGPSGFILKIKLHDCHCNDCTITKYCQ